MDGGAVPRPARPGGAKEGRALILIAHAYSRRNAGDSLLVDLTFDYLHRAGRDTSDAVVLALDPTSFSDLPRVRAVGTPARRPTRDMLPALRTMASTGAHIASKGRARAALAELFDRARAIIGVPGGYLRAGDPVESLGCLINHMPQLGLAARADVPTIYLPQSIGPLRGPVGAMVRSNLARLDLVCVRDDRSAADLAELQPARYPDVAVMQLARTLGDAAPRAGTDVVLVARALRDRGYEARLRSLATLLGERAVWAVQAQGAAGKSDADFYARVGIEPAGSLREVLAAREGGVVVSVRLHGAMQALLAGWPAIHLGYQRKSWSAFADIGLEPYVHDAQRFDPRAVAEQADALAWDATAMWRSIEARRDGLLEADERLVEELRARIASSVR